MKFKTLNSTLVEMARIGYIDDIEIYIHTDDPGNVPHIHLRDAETQGNNFHCCIRLDKPEYTGKEGILNNKEKKQLIEFLQEPCSNKKFQGTNWERVIMEWNDNNSSVILDEDFPMPDYKLL